MDVFRLPSHLRHILFLRPQPCRYAPAARFLRASHSATDSPLADGDVPQFEDLPEELASEIAARRQKRSKELLEGKSKPQRHKHADQRPMRRLNAENLHHYTHTTPPNPAQLEYATAFFHASTPALLYSEAQFRALPPSHQPEVALLGRSNVGKSSLFNALFNRTKLEPARVSKNVGHTRTMNGYGVSGGIASGPGHGFHEAWQRFPRSGLIVVDLPGYGGGSNEVWGKEAMKLVERRKQLRRAFVLIDGLLGPKKQDAVLLDYLRRNGIGYQIILTKVDKVMGLTTSRVNPVRMSDALYAVRKKVEWARQKLARDLLKNHIDWGDVLCCTTKGYPRQLHRVMGLDAIRWAMLSACGMESDEMGMKKKIRLTEVESSPKTVSKAASAPNTRATRV